jgi:hypothetical protein
MSKNECKTCKNYVQAWIDVSGEHGDCTLYPTWLDVPAAHYCGQWASTGEQQVLAALDIDWSQVPGGYDWVAQDSNGDIYAWSTKPVRTEAEGGYWRWRGEKGTQFYVCSTTWREADINRSLASRPDTN